MLELEVTNLCRKFLYTYRWNHFVMKFPVWFPSRYVCVMFHSYGISKCLLNGGNKQTLDLPTVKIKEPS